MSPDPSTHSWLRAALASGVAVPVAAPSPAAEPVASQPVASQPVASQPVASQPVVTRSVAAPILAARPVATRPVAAGPAVLERSVPAAVTVVPPVAVPPVAVPPVPGPARRRAGDARREADRSPAGTPAPVPAPVPVAAPAPVRPAEDATEVAPRDGGVTERAEGPVDEPGVWTPSGAGSQWGSSRAVVSAPMRRMGSALPAALTAVQADPRYVAGAALRLTVTVAAGVVAVLVAVLAAFALSQLSPTASPLVEPASAAEGGGIPDSGVWIRGVPRRPVPARRD